MSAIDTTSAAETPLPVQTPDPATSPEAAKSAAETELKDALSGADKPAEDGAAGGDQPAEGDATQGEDQKTAEVPSVDEFIDPSLGIAEDFQKEMITKLGPEDARELLPRLAYIGHMEQTFGGLPDLQAVGKAFEAFDFVSGFNQALVENPAKAIETLLFDSTVDPVTQQAKLVLTDDGAKIAAGFALNVSRLPDAAYFKIVETVTTDMVNMLERQAKRQQSLKEAALQQGRKTESQEYELEEFALQQAIFQLQQTKANAAQRTSLNKSSTQDPELEQRRKELATQQAEFEKRRAEAAKAEVTSRVNSLTQSLKSTYDSELKTAMDRVPTTLPTKVRESIERELYNKVNEAVAKGEGAYLKDHVARFTQSGDPNLASKTVNLYKARVKAVIASSLPQVLKDFGADIAQASAAAKQTADAAAAKINGPGTGSIPAGESKDDLKRNPGESQDAWNKRVMAHFLGGK